MRKPAVVAGFLYLWYSISMENMPNDQEAASEQINQRNRKFGDRVIRKVIGGASEVTLNPILFGIAYRDERVYPYIQAGLAQEDIATHIATDLIESGSESKITRDRLIVDSRPEKQS